MRYALLMIMSVVILFGLSARLDAKEITKKPTLIETLFDIERSTKEDVLYLRNKDVLHGRVINETITIATQYGMLKVPLRRCAGLSFEGAKANAEVIVTVNFNRVSGIIIDRVINFQIKSTDTKIAIRKENIRFLLLQRKANEADFTKKSPKADLFLMTNGDILSGETVERKITIRTGQTKTPVALAEMRDIKMQSGDKGTAVISKTNGKTLQGILDTSEITLDMEIGIQVQAIYKNKFAQVFVDQARKQSPVQFGSPFKKKKKALTRAVGVSIAAPNTNWSLRPSGVYLVGKEVHVVWQLMDRGGMGMSVIRTLKSAVFIAPTDLPVKHFLLGKRWNWGNGGPYTFIGADAENAFRKKLAAGKKLPWSVAPVKAGGNPSLELRKSF
ncbi:MAG: hypothetical protein GY794_00355 [bacterium]|nr:hypothetical protein [bacterium]